MVFRDPKGRQVKHFYPKNKAGTLSIGLYRTLTEKQTMTTPCLLIITSGWLCPEWNGVARRGAGEMLKSR